MDFPLNNRFIWESQY